jgi:hypothetical protein
MPDEWPRRYTQAELNAIAKSIGHSTLNAAAFDKLQEAVEGYQWGSLVDDRIFRSSTNKGRRKKLKNVIELCEQGAPASSLERVANELDAVASQLLGPVNRTERIALQRAAEIALTKMKISGPDPKRARLQFVRELASIFNAVTGKVPGRRVHDQEYGPFRDFVRSALTPFDATMGSDADIKSAVRRWKKDSIGRRKA